MRARGGRARARSLGRGRRPFFLTVAGVATLSLAFALGVLVGRQWTGNAVRPAESGQEGAAAGRRHALSDAGTIKPPEIQGKLTFYRTLTAPATPMPPPSRPPAARPPELEIGPQGGSEDGVGGSDRAYTIQVMAHRTRTAADATERKLRAAGFQAYVVALDDNGRTTYRVRVGRFTSRAPAEQLAKRLRKEHDLSPFVTTR